MFRTFDKVRKAMRLAQNRALGKLAESLAVANLVLNGYVDIRKVHVGADYVARKYNPWTGRVGPPEFFEVKATRTAPLSKRQKEMMRRYRKRYHVIRVF